MIRSVKVLLFIASLGLVVGISFAGGQRIRRAVANPLVRETRISSLTDSGLAGMLNFAQREQGDGSSPADTFQDVYRYVKSEYVDRVDNDRKLSFGAVKTMLMSLDDPKTRFLEPDQLKKTRDQMDGKYSGIGATVAVIKQKKGTIDQRRLAVVAPVPGGPADKAGVRAGDIITYVDNKWVIAYDPRADLDKVHVKDMDDTQLRKATTAAFKRLQDGMSLPKALETIAADGKTIDLTLERPGVAEPIKVKVATGPTTIEPAEFKPVGDHAGYLRITQFSDRAQDAIKVAVNAPGQTALIVDLRDNSGGPIAVNQPLPPAAATLLSSLVGGGNVGTLVKRGGTSEPIRVEASNVPKRKIAVLINGGTANTAEVVASALKDKAGASLIGSHTFGDSIMQRLVNLRDGAAMTLSAGKYLTAGGQEFTGKGINPDVAIATGGPSVDDPAYKRAVAAVTGA